MNQSQAYKCRLLPSPPLPTLSLFSPYVYVGPCGWCSYHHYPSQYPHVHVLITLSMSSEVSGVQRASWICLDFSLRPHSAISLSSAKDHPPGKIIGSYTPSLAAINASLIIGSKQTGDAFKGTRQIHVFCFRWREKKSLKDIIFEKPFFVLPRRISIFLTHVYLFTH